MKKRRILALVASIVALTAGAQNFVPRPVSVSYRVGVATLAPFPSIEVTHPELEPLQRYLTEYLPAGRVTLALDRGLGLPAEGYRLEVAREGITIRGADYSGVWNAVQTLLQLFPAAIYDKTLPAAGLTLPLIAIEDWPQMPYRGVMLDVARTFVPKARVLKLIEDIARHKINKLHLHLTDDEGWRIEIKSHPELTSVGAFRGPGAAMRAVYGEWEARYGGFYTQDDIREMVAWAAVRGVEIIPEIDLPGHSRAAAIALPQLLCRYKPDLRASAGYDTRGVWCVAREENYRLLNDIVGEVAALFPAEVIHFGGDEVTTSQWSHCPDCKALTAQRGLSSPAMLEDIFIEHAVAIAAQHGKRTGVWNEAAARGKIGRSTTVWGWENLAAVRKSASASYSTIMCAGPWLYFDQAQYRGAAGHTWAGVVSLEKVYSAGAVIGGFAPTERDNIVGVEGTFFSELLLAAGPEFLDYQLFPRMCALAEVGWAHPKTLSWSDFERRMTTPAASAPSHTERLAAMGIDYCSGLPVLQPKPTYKTPAATFTSSLRQSDTHPFAPLAAYKRPARTLTTAVEGDWFLWSFAVPVACSAIEVQTGYHYMQRAGIPRGRLEVSYDGRTFTTIAHLHDLHASATIDPNRPIRAARIVSESHGNGESYVIINPLKVR